MHYYKVEKLWMTTKFGKIYLKVGQVIYYRVGQSLGQYLKVGQILQSRKILSQSGVSIAKWRIYHKKGQYTFETLGKTETHVQW